MSLKAGDGCPDCQRGKVYPQRDPGVLVRIRGQAPIAATVYEFMSLIQACELNGVNPFDYLTELLRHAEELK